MAGVEPEHVIGHGRVAGETVRLAGIIPGLRGDAAAIGDQDIFCETAGEQIGVAVIRPPFVSDAIGRAIDVADKHARFEAAQDSGVRGVGVELEGLHEHGSGRESPVILG